MNLKTWLFASQILKYLYNFRSINLVLAFLIPCALSIELSCRFNFFISVYECKVENLEIDAPKTFVDGVYGHHWFRMTNNNVEMIEFQSSERKISFLPHGVGKVFLNIKTIHASNVGLKAITSGDLKQFPKLENLHLPRNQIQELQPGLFDYNPALKLISIFQNEISVIAANIFDNLEHLEVVLIEQNICNIKSAKSRTEVRHIKFQIAKKCDKNLKGKEADNLEYFEVLV